MQIKLSTNWQKIFDELLKQDYFKSILNQVDDLYLSRTIFPPRERIFACFNYFNIENTKVVIIGQDPYYKPNQANGLSFSVNSGCKIPKSLNNIFKELKNDLNIERTNENLEDWAKQGVLLLNGSLTVEYNKPMSHKYLNWEKVTDFIISYLNKHVNNVVYILWGNYAIKKAKLIDANKNKIISSAHPSPLSAYNGFFGSKPFSKTNNYLISLNKKPIKW